MVKFFKTNWPLLLLGLIAAMILGRIMEIRRTELPRIKKLEQEEKNRLRPITKAPHGEQKTEAIQQP